MLLPQEVKHAKLNSFKLNFLLHFERDVMLGKQREHRSAKLLWAGENVTVTLLNHAAYKQKPTYVPQHTKVSSSLLTPLNLLGE